MPEGLAVALPGTTAADFELKGRVDLIMAMPGSAPCDPVAGEFTDTACWVVDYKTGSAKKLTDKKIAAGEGLQPVLYALAVQKLGAAEVDVSIQTRDAELEPQVSLDDIAKGGAAFPVARFDASAGDFRNAPRCGESVRLLAELSDGDAFHPS